ncbi:Hypothetical predicted protein [Pelobates cultripes]|uniref:Uncharacterized protein n=1 Tax=Pelobates cultripes TaxID=61616 RepID=A0AAD1SDF8_PELCU|nr:Hypothetical predicted protein [Pelobates cultripes]
MELCKQQQEVCQAPPETGTEDRDEDHKTPQVEEDPKKKIKVYQERLLTLHAEALKFANQAGIISDISNQTEDEPQGTYKIPPAAEMEIQDQEVCQVPPETGTEDRDEDHKTPQVEEDPKKKIKVYQERLLTLHAEALKFAHQAGIISDIFNQTEDEPQGTYKIPPAAEMEIQDQQEVCQVPPETGTEDRDEDHKTPQVEEDPKKKIKVYQERLLTPHAEALKFANRAGIISDIFNQTEDEPQGTYKIPPAAEMEIQDQQEVRQLPAEMGTEDQDEVYETPQEEEGPEKEKQEYGERLLKLVSSGFQ